MAWRSLRIDVLRNMFCFVLLATTDHEFQNSSMSFSFPVTTVQKSGTPRCICCIRTPCRSSFWLSCGIWRTRWTDTCTSVHLAVGPYQELAQGQKPGGWGDIRPLMGFLSAATCSAARFESEPLARQAWVPARVCKLELRRACVTSQAQGSMTPCDNNEVAVHRCAVTWCLSRPVVGRRGA